jgi:hypothetical protein
VPWSARHRGADDGGYGTASGWGVARNMPWLRIGVGMQMWATSSLQQTTKLKFKFFFFDTKFTAGR